MNPRHLIPQALTEASFAPYGRVLQVPADGHGGQSINDGTSQRFELVANALLTDDAGRPVISISRALARVLPMDLLGMERRRLGSQSFVPLGAARRFVVVVAAAGVPAEAQAGQLQACVADGSQANVALPLCLTPAGGGRPWGRSQGVMLAPGTWHHGLLALDAGDYLVLERRGDAVDCDLADLALPVRLAWQG